ncbi:glycoside hydrolase family 20 [Pedobacter yulinensis]|uniref:beta-N-acetylhexosaminidase n=1 Tax=Pedobacter yulinensis TaxID=2126353 RepID=A0A2T3HHA7_9SPHI|nr:beta-N-acetylhexosaminidase [Pedobacter yulinensis]PST81828.1 glycoside hydrolase family 20 [Pedobacter yulinensis]
MKFNQKITLFFLLLFLAGVPVRAQRIIPQPASMTTGNGSYTLPATVAISGAADLDNEVRDLSTYLNRQFGRRSNRVKTKPAIRLVKNPALKNLGKEGYRLNIGKEGVKIEGPTAAGIFYGLQSFKQLLKREDGKLSAPFVTISDQPRFSWRSYMLDESRYFQGKEVVKKVLDEMAMLKLNIFHWHLTDDPGWRIEIDQYPELTRVGSKRDSTVTGSGANRRVGKAHGGFYTKAEIRDILAYAAARHIQVIPEIEMPGHSSAAIASYPWLGVTKKPIRVPTRFGVFADVYDVTDPRVTDFLHNVLNEVIDLFPSDIIHIGGDEVRFEQWEQSDAVAAYKKKHNLASSADLQIFFTNKMSDYLAGKGKRMMGWNEILGSKVHDYSDTKPVTGKLASNTIVHFWKGELDMVTDAVSKGYDVVNSYHLFTYLDYSYQSIPLKKSYDFDPVPAGLDPRYTSKILGSGCQMWGEGTPDSVAIYRQTFPRIAAYAEVNWTPVAKKDFEAFSKQLNFFRERWKARGINPGM